ncbi:MAG: phospho-N-acetylmuramoyl-pentapeptide-transferase [Halanaerobiaceae bacterium]
MQYFAAVGLPFIILIVTGPTLIGFLKRFNYGQQVRKEGPESHLKKEGIPTMGGVLIILGIVITALLLLKLNPDVLWVLIITGGMGLVGLLDDVLKIKGGQSLGLRAREKLVAQLILGLVIALYLYIFRDEGTLLLIPFLGVLVDFEFWIVPLTVLTVVGTVNAVNLTDGLDGLAAGVTALAASAFAVIYAFQGFNQLTLLSLSITGACIGFIWFNSYPAQVFMGDVGSLALGGALASMAVLSQTQLFLVIIGGVYVMEALSVMIQVTYFRLTDGERVFKMTPIHHHFELMGLSESKVVARFWIMSMIFAAFGLISYFAGGYPG